MTETSLPEDGIVHHNRNTSKYSTPVRVLCQANINYSVSTLVPGTGGNRSVPNPRPPSHLFSSSVS